VQMYYSLTGMRDAESSSDYESSDASSAGHSAMDFAILSFNCGVEGQTSSTISLAVTFTWIPHKSSVMGIDVDCVVDPCRCQRTPVPHFGGFLSALRS
jgi:hypothetical protein